MQPWNFRSVAVRLLSREDTSLTTQEIESLQHFALGRQCTILSGSLLYVPMILGGSADKGLNAVRTFVQLIAEIASYTPVSPVTTSFCAGDKQVDATCAAITVNGTRQQFCQDKWTTLQYWWQSFSVCTATVHVKWWPALHRSWYHRSP